MPATLNAWSVGVGGVDRITQAGCAVWNAGLGEWIHKQWPAALNIGKLFDKRYCSTIGWRYADNHFGEPHNAKVTLRGKF